MVILYLQFSSLIAIVFTVFANKYEFEFLEAKIFKRCSKFPNNFLDQALDLSNWEVGKTDEGTLIMDGYIVLKRSYDHLLPFSMELLKRERGTYQPTTINIKRLDSCKATFDKYDVIFNYVKETPKDQTKCPFKKGQIVTMKVSKPVLVYIPSRNAAGEYLIHVEIGNRTDMSTFLCSEIPVNVHKV
ncbi:uncharacterized protein LOC119608735 isoform X2 [Lucilia sericata]|uniref:uncharacterized protein LOC119608735 isoform X2 n=1 Tax=Lucilia sericata TaxID=13632 RepID=UPI0018A86E31|nr:uncharacterized protein LOC119608735 isoform X2 [Lucilia sericata]